MTFYDLLREVSREKGTSPCAVALALGMSKSNASNWKRGKSPRLDVLIKIAEHLDVPFERLLPNEMDGVSVVVAPTKELNTIYAIRCRHNGKVYIGRTQNVERRMRGHLTELKAGKKDSGGRKVCGFQEDFNKYGESGFEVYILEEKVSSDSVTEREMHWIKEYSAADPRYGYNKFVKKESVGFDNFKAGLPPKINKGGEQS